MTKVHIRNTVIVTENTDGRGIQLNRCQNAVISGGSVTAYAACICTESSTVTLEEKPLLICRAAPDTPIQGDGITGEYRTEK